MTCNDPCPNPKDASSNKLTIHVAAGVGALGVSQLSVSIYPNPNDGNFTLQTTEAGTISIYNMQGQVVAAYNITQQKTNIILPASLNSGVYIAKFISANNQMTVLRIVYER
jgi:hypothetical protein